MKSRPVCNLVSIPHHCPTSHTSGLGQFPGRHCSPGFVQDAEVPIGSSTYAGTALSSRCCFRCGPPARLFYSASTFLSSQTRIGSRYNALVFGRSRGRAFLLPRCWCDPVASSFQSVVKRWPRDGLSGAVNSIGQLSACPNTRLYHQL